MEEQDPLKELLANDIKSIDKRKLTDFLKAYIFVDPSTEEIGFTENYRGLDSNIKKIEIVLLASKARSLIFEEQEDGLTPIEIIRMEIMPEGSVKSSLKKLADDHLIKQNANGKYLIPDYGVTKLIQKY